MSLPTGTPVKVQQGGSFVSGILRVWNATLGQWVTPVQVTPLSAIPTVQTTLLPFNQTAYTGAPKVFAHYFTQFPLQPGGDTTDYWVHWTKPGAVEAASATVTGSTTAAAATGQAIVTIGTANAAKVLAGDHVTFNGLTGLYQIASVNTTTGTMTMTANLVTAVASGTGYVAIRGGTDNRISGGYVRDRTIKRYYSTLADTNAAEIADMVTEINWAIGAGIDGFWVDILGLPGSYHWTRLLHLFAAADQVFASTGKRFWIAPMPDGTAGAAASVGGNGNSSADALANALVTLKTQASYWKIGSDFVVPVFGPEDIPSSLGVTPLAYWTRMKATMATGGMTTKYIFCYVGDWTTLAPTYNSIVYGHSRWGDRDATAVAAANNYNRNAPSYCHTTFPGKTWAHFGAPGDTRPNSAGYAVSSASYLTWENKGFSALNGTWRAAIDGGADFVQCTTWNDFSENAHIVPSVNNTFALADLTAYYAQWLKNGAQPPVVRDALYLSHRVAPTGQQAAAMPGTNQLHFSQVAGGTALANIVDVTCFLTSSATVQFLVNGVVTGSVTAPAGYSRQEFALPASGVVSARAQRSSVTVPGTTVVSEQVVATTGNLADDYHYRGYSSLRQTASQATGSGVTRVQDLTNGDLNKATTGIVSLPSATYVMGYDFNKPSNYPVYCAFVQAGVTSITGVSVDDSVLIVAPNSMSAASAAQIPAQPATYNVNTAGVNPLYMLRIDSANLSKLTIKGTDQVVGGVKQMFNGVVDYHGSNKNHSDVRIKAVPGNNSANPGETFSYNGLSLTGTNTYTRFEIDGTDDSGVSVGASGFGMNGCSGTYNFTDCSAHHMGFGSGITFYNCTGTVNLTRFNSHHNYYSDYNFERNTGLVVNMVNCTFRTTGRGVGKPLLTVWTDHTSNVINIYDPVFDPDANGKFVVDPGPATSAGSVNGAGANVQLQSDIHLFVNGVERRDLLVFTQGNPGTPSVPAGYTAYPSSPANFSAGINAKAATYLPGSSYQFSDFAIGNSPYLYGAQGTTCTSLAGAGQTLTAISMKANTSTRASYVAGLASGATNALHLLAFGVKPSNSADGGGPKITLQDFTLNGTAQGHLYGGFRIDWSASPVTRRVKVTGIPGNAAEPPGETFSGNWYRCLNALIDQCEFDGRQNGTKVAASLVGINNSDNTTIQNSYIHHSGYGIGVAIWQSTGGTITGTTFEDLAGSPIHIEKSDGVWNVRNCTWISTHGGDHIVISGHYAPDIWRTGNCTLNIYDPVYDNLGDGKFHVSAFGSNQANSKGSGTTPAAINLYINGVLRPDLLYVH